MTKDQKTRLEDGSYPCAATLSIVKGQAIVTLHDDFGLPADTRIELARQPEGSVIVVYGPDGNLLFNGHTVI